MYQRSLSARPEICGDASLIRETVKRMSGKSTSVVSNSISSSINAYPGSEQEKLSCSCPCQTMPHIVASMPFSVSLSKQLIKYSTLLYVSIYWLWSQWILDILRVQNSLGTSHWGDDMKTINRFLWNCPFVNQNITRRWLSLTAKHKTIFAAKAISLPRILQYF